jgi:hypothetical protein
MELNGKRGGNNTQCRNSGKKDDKRRNHLSFGVLGNVGTASLLGDYVKLSGQMLAIGMHSGTALRFFSANFILH